MTNRKTKDEYVSPIQVLDSYWEKPWSKLHKKQQQAWLCVYLASTFSINEGDEVSGEWFWSDLNPEGRRDQAERFDYKTNPARKGEKHVDWYNVMLDASMWFKRGDVSPSDAAMLLCQQNPRGEMSGGRLVKPTPKLITTTETNPRDYQRLLDVFEDVARVQSQKRTLQQWMDIAKFEALKYHSWIDRYVAASPMFEASESDDENAGACAKQRSRPIPKQRFQD